MIISIITIHLDDFSGLERTLESLVSLNSDDNLEWVVVDGGSNRNNDTGDVLEKVASMADQFVSEPDDGIYDAMNKGTRLAGGDYVLYLNAGDELHPDFRLTLLAEQVEASQGYRKN